MPYIQLSQYQGEGPTEREVLPIKMEKRLKIFPILYENTNWLTVGDLKGAGQDQVISFLQEMLKECGG